MSGRRVHILGGSGSGTTTLGAALAHVLAIPHFDTDTYFWAPSDPPFREPRPEPERQALLKQTLDNDAEWVLSGSLDGWGDSIIPRFTLVAMLTLPVGERLERLRLRQQARFGARIELGGDMYEQHQEFMTWAGLYDSGRLDMRTRARHERWLKALPCPVLHLDGSSPTPVLVEAMLASFTDP